MELKTYQQKTLDALEKFLTAAKSIGSASAFEQYRNAPSYPRAYSPLPGLDDAPYICLRLPTGGGKTLLGACAIRVATEKFLGREYPLVLWLVPSDVIRHQTLKLLHDPKKFYRQKLDEAFKGQVNIFDVTEFRQLRPQDLKQSLNIFVATFQSFRVTDREGRKVYQSNEDLEACFRDIPWQEYFRADATGDYKSFGNLIAHERPLMIVDEAHNNSTQLSLEYMTDLRPAAVIELTATPAREANVLYQVSAEELKTDSMIKLPIMLRESLSWEEAIDAAVQRRAALERSANREASYVRPIVLFQAETRNGEANVDAVKEYLIEEAKVPENQIAIATGDRRELEGVNLSARDCPIRCVITVQALKEGWDCPFAYVFCSVAKVNSATSAEQFLGRVLRMPYATRRESPALNKAYAFMVVNNWHEAADKVHDNLLGMGFEKPEVEQELRQQSLDLRTTIRIHTTNKPQLGTLNLGLQGAASVDKTAAGYELTLADITEADVVKLSKAANKIFTDDGDREKFLDALYDKEFEPAQVTIVAPAARGVKFEMPLLCLDFGDRVDVAEREDFLPEDWRLTGNYDTDLPNFSRDLEAQVYEFDVKGHKVTEQYIGDEATNLFHGETNWTQSELVGWLADKIISTDLNFEDLAEFIRRVLARLSAEQQIALDEMVRLRFSLLKVLEEKVADCRAAALKKGWQQKLFGEDSRACVRPNIARIFDTKNYPAKSFYQGHVQFEKHYYKLIGDMNPEEIRCAQLIDGNKNVAAWIRNVDSEPRYSFWLPTYKGKFYPDFVVKLKDGSYAAIEYKGEDRKTNDDSRAKNLVGELWQRQRGGKFLLATQRDDRGRDLATQLKDFLR